MDVSANLVNAATRQRAEEDAIEARFARVDAMPAEAVAGAESLPPLPEVDDDALTEEERRAVRAVRDLVYGSDGRPDR